MSEAKPQNTRLIKVTLLLISSLTVMAGAIIAPALPEVAKVFKATTNVDLLTKLMLTLPALVIALSGPFTGLIIDLFGRKRLLLFSIIFFAVAGSSGLYLWSLYSLLVGRLLLGVAVAGIMTVSTTLIGDYFIGSERNQFMGWQGAFMALGGAVFLFLGGTLADINWRLPFAIYLFSLPLFPLVRRHIFEPLVRSTELKDKVEAPRGYTPMTVLGIYATAFAIMVFFYMIPVQIPFLFKDFPGISNQATGIALSSTTLAGAFVAMMYKWVKSKLSFQLVYTVTFAFMGLGFMIIGYSSAYIPVVIGLVIAGLGAGFMLPNTNVWLVTISPENMRGRLVGGLTMAIFLGQFFSPIIIQPLAEIWSLTTVFFACGNVMWLIAFLFIWLNMRKKSEMPPEQEIAEFEEDNTPALRQ